MAILCAALGKQQHTHWHGLCTQHVIFIAWREYEKEKLRIEDEKQRLEDAKLIQDTLASIQSAPPPPSSTAQEAIVISDDEEISQPTISLDTDMDHHESSGGTKRQQPSPSSSPSPSDDHDQDDDFRPVKIPRVIQQQLHQQQAKKEPDESQPIQLEDGEELHEFLKRVEEHNKSRPKQRIPKIFVGSRTYVWMDHLIRAIKFIHYLCISHKQLAQLVGELKGNTRYRPSK